MRITRIAAVVVAAVMIGSLLAACAPRFPSHSVLQATATGRLVNLRWTAAQADPGRRVTAYGIEVNGKEVTRAPGSRTACVLTGLAGGARYRVSVVAYDSAGRKSKRWKPWAPDRAAVSTSIAVPNVGAPASPGFACAPAADRDGDRLPDAYETGTGGFLDVHATGTSADDHDSDNDGLSDGDEVLGTRAGLDLHAVGARPTKKDLLVEFDWFDDSNDCGAHSHRPSPALMDQMKLSMARVDLPSPDGTTGINLIADIGQGGALSGGNHVPDADGIIDDGVVGDDFTGIKATNFRAERQGYFHYQLMPHRLEPGAPQTGEAWGPGMDSVVSIWICNLATIPSSNIILHELGHNIGLDHGGDQYANFKPNYNSIMNYAYLFSGTDTDCREGGDAGASIFSDGSRAPIDENALLEPVGICNGVPIDFNHDGQIQPEPLKLDLTPFTFGETVGDGIFEVLTDYDDLANICLECIEPFQHTPAGAGQRAAMRSRLMTEDSLNSM